MVALVYSTFGNQKRFHCPQLFPSYFLVLGCFFASGQHSFMDLVVFGELSLTILTFFSFLHAGSIYFCQRELGTSNAASVFDSYPGIVSNTANTGAERQSSSCLVIGLFFPPLILPFLFIITLLVLLRCQSFGFRNQKMGRGMSLQQVMAMILRKAGCAFLGQDLVMLLKKLRAWKSRKTVMIVAAIVNYRPLADQKVLQVANINSTAEILFKNLMIKSQL